MKSISFSITQVNRLRCQRPVLRLRHAPAQAGIRPACLRVQVRSRRQRDHLGGAGGRLKVLPGQQFRATRQSIGPSEATGNHPINASDQGRRESLVVPVRIDPPPRGGRTRGPSARLRLDPPDDSGQAPAVGRQPGCAGLRADPDRRRARRRLDVVRLRSEELGADLCRAGVETKGRPAHPRSRRPRADLPGYRHLSG